MFAETADVESWKQILDYGIPLALLVGVVWYLCSAARTLYVDVIKPVLGPDGHVVNHLKNQESEAKVQTAELKRMSSALEQTWASVHSQMMELIKLSADNTSFNQSMREEIADMLSIHMHWADAFKKMAADDESFAAALKRIQAIASKYTDR